MGNNYYLSPPIKQLFYRFIADMMSSFSVGKRTAWGYHNNTKMQVINSKVMHVFAPLCAISQIVYLYQNYSDLSFDILGIIFAILPPTCLANVDIYSAKMESYERLSEMFLEKIHLYNIYAETKNEFIKKKLIILERVTRWTSGYVIFFSISNSLGWIILTAFNNYKNKELVLNHTVRLQTSLFMWMPFDYGYNYKNWIIIHLINCYTVLNGASAMMIFQCINYIFIFHIIGHIYVMKYSLTMITDDLSDIETHAKLSKIVDHNNFIIGIFDDVQRAFGYNVATNYLQNLFGNSVLMYQVMYGGKESVLLYLGMMLAYTGGPIILSFILEEVKRQTYTLPDLVYSMPWENMSVSNQKIVIQILQRSQILMDFKAFGGMKAGVGPIMSILKTTFSYYLMLESSIAKDD